MGKGRHKKARAGNGGRAAGKRRHSGGGAWRGAGGAGGGLTLSDSDDGPGTLRIGGVVIRVDAAGNGVAELPQQGVGHRRQRRRAAAGSVPVHRHRSSSRGDYLGSDSEDSGGEEKEEVKVDDAAMEDYLANLGAAQKGAARRGSSGSSDDSGSQADAEGRGGSAAKRRRQAYEQYEVLRRFSGFDMGDEGPPEELGWPGFSSDEDSDDSSSSDGSGSSSAGDGDGSEDSSSSGSSSSDSSSEGDSGEDGSEAGELMEADLQQLSLAQRYPVQVRPRPPPLSGQRQTGKQASGGQGKKKKKSKPGVKGAKGGKLAPGEKKRLKHERMEAKRAARAAARGFDLVAVNREMEEFVLRQGDMHAFGPFGKHEGAAVARLAALYGCRATLQGSKRDRKVVMVSSTPRTCLPQGSDLLAVGQILAAQSAAERSGAALDGRLAAAVAGADLTSVLPASLTGGAGRGRWADVRQQRNTTSGDSAKKAKKKRSTMKPVAFVSKPVAFVSVGTIDPDQAVAVAAAAAAAGGGSEGGDVEMAGGAPVGVEAAVVVQVQAEAADRQVFGVQRWRQQQRGDQAEQQQQQQQEGASAAVSAGLQLLEVVEDRGDLAEEHAGLGFAAADSAGLSPASGPAAAAAAAAAKAARDEEGVYASDEASEEDEGPAGLGGGGRTLYTRMTGLSLQGPSDGASPGGSARGAAAAAGITNPGRLLGLGLALGLGAEVFGAPGPAQLAGPGALDADLLPLSPMMSKSQLRKLQRRASGGSSVPGGGSLAAAVAAAGGKQQQQPGRKAKPGRSKQERRSRGGGAPLGLMPSSDGEGRQQWQGEDAGKGRPMLGGPAGGDAEAPLVSGDYGHFEQHTTGIGSRLLSKWGFGGEGSGLGRSQQGRAEPLQAVRRAKGLGLGAER